VTDKDIDLFTKHSLLSLFPQDNIDQGKDNEEEEEEEEMVDRMDNLHISQSSPHSRSLIPIIQSSKNVCKMKHAVGDAVICYGLPIKISSKRNSIN